MVLDRQDKAFDGAISARVFKAAKKLSEGTTDHAVSRVANRFALVQVALEIAHSYNILPFPVDRIEWAVKRMFADWLTQRGGDGSIEIKNAIKRIEHLLVTNEFSDRVFRLPENNDRAVRNLLAYRKLDLEGHTEEFWVPTTVFDKEFCDGVNKTELVKELQRIGWLLPPRPDGKSIRIRKIKGTANYYYVFGKRENGGDTSDTGDTSISNPLSVTVPPVSPSITYPKTEGDTGDTYKNNPCVSITSITGVSRASDTGITHKNPLGATDPGTVSPVSPVSPPKTDLGDSISKTPLKVGDRVRYVGKSQMHRGSFGKVISAEGGLYACDFMGLTAKGLTCNDLEVI